MIALTIIAFVTAVASIVATFLSKRCAIIAASVAMACAWLGGLALPQNPFPVLSLILWGVSALMVGGLMIMLPRDITASRLGVGYLAGATLAGALLGWAIGQNWLVIGAIIGLVLGALAYISTPAGKGLRSVPGGFRNLLFAKGFPVLVTITMAIIAIVWGVYTLNPVVE